MRAKAPKPKITTASTIEEGSGTPVTSTELAESAPPIERPDCRSTWLASPAVATNADESAEKRLLVEARFLPASELPDESLAAMVKRAGLPCEPPITKALSTIESAV
ncbi:MAG TPA: hypothetical protein VGH32_09855, partial [Pirellulales bacterium]